MSDEGVLMFVRHLRMSVEDWVELKALVTELGQLRPALTSLVSGKTSTERDRQLAVMAGWLHRRRRRVLRRICCKTEDQRQELLETCELKLAQYR